MTLKSSSSRYILALLACWLFAVVLLACNKAEQENAESKATAQSTQATPVPTATPTPTPTPTPSAAQIALQSGDKEKVVTAKQLFDAAPSKQTEWPLAGNQDWLRMALTDNDNSLKLSAFLHGDVPTPTTLETPVAPGKYTLMAEAKMRAEAEFPGTLTISLVGGEDNVKQLEKLTLEPGKSLPVKTSFEVNEDTSCSLRFTTEMAPDAKNASGGDITLGFLHLCKE